MQAPIILFLGSTSLHFPLDLYGILVNEGQEAKRFESIDDFLSTPDRHTPYVAVLEIGSTEDVDRALLAYEWCEQIQPIAPCRTLLLIASKNIQLGDRAGRFGNAEIAHLPLPLKNLLFKIDLQKRLLLSDQAQAAAERGKKPAGESGFSAAFVERPPRLDRILLLRGPGPKKGYWQEAGESPAGKVRWRWVSTQQPEERGETAGVSWEAESRVKPVYEEESGAWAVDDPDADLLGFKKDKPVFSARTSLRRPPVRPETEGKQKFAREKSATGGQRSFAKEGNRSVTADALVDAKSPPRPGGPAQLVRAEEPAPSGGEKKFVNEAGETAAAQKFQPRATPTASARHLTRPTGEKTGETIIHRPGAPTAPEWKSHQSPAAPAKGGADRLRSAQEPPAAGAPGEEKSPAPGALPAKQAKPPADTPERFREEKPEDRSGRSVPATSSGSENRRKAEPVTAGAAAPPAPRAPRREADDPPGPPDKVKSIYKEGVSETRPPAAEAEPPAAEKGRAEPATEETAAAAARTAPKAVAETSRPAGDAPRPAPPARTAREGPAPGKPAAAAPAEAKSPAAPEIETRLSPDGPTGTGQAARAEGRGGEPGQEKIKIKGDPAAERINTEVALEGTPEHRGEEIRVRARAGGDSSHAPKPGRTEPENFLKYRHFVTMTLDELSDRDSSWHPMHRYRIYLSANHRYYGIKDPATLLPLWVYEGELAPEFLEDKRAWKFYDRYPELYSALDTLPPVVLDQIYTMAGKPPPGAGGGVPGQVGPDVTEGTATAVAGPVSAEPEAEKGIWGGVKRFLKRIFGG